MRRFLMMAGTAGSVGMLLAAGTVLAVADDSDRRQTAAGFELEIDRELDATFGPRPVNAVQAAEIVARVFPGARVTEAELDENGGGPIWEITFELRGAEREVDVDAVTGAVLGDDGGSRDGRSRGGDDD